MPEHDLSCDAGEKGREPLQAVTVPGQWRYPFAVAGCFRSGFRTSPRSLSGLMLTLHPVKRFIGRTEKGFDFLGYQIHPNRKLRPSAVSLHRLTELARRLYEREASIKRLWQYVIKWHRWLHGGLDGMVSNKGGFTKYWGYVLKALHITGDMVQT